MKRKKIRGMSLERAKALLEVLAQYGVISPEADVQLGAEVLIMHIQNLEQQLNEIRQNDRLNTPNV